MSFVQQNTFPAAAPKKSFPYHFGNGPALVQTLSSLGLVTPTPVITAVAAAGKPIGLAGVKIDVHALDAVLAGYEIDTRKRMQFKTMLRRQGVLPDQ